MSLIYKGDVGARLSISTNNLALAQADEYTLRIRSPSGATAEWEILPGNINFATGLIVYDTASGDIPEAGEYAVQVHRVNDGTGDETNSDIDKFEVLDTIW